jgi:DNA-binding transcriptional regulator GbsR (MarR family)
VPNDTVRLFSQGVITGFQNDITSLVIQRRIFEEEIDSAIADKDLETAKQLLREYQELDTPQNIRSRMTDEQVRLESLTSDKREVDHIRRMFDNLNEVVSAEINKSRESELQASVQQLSSGR